MKNNRPDISLLNVLETPAEWREWIEEDPNDAPAISDELSELMIEIVSCRRFINWPITGVTKEMYAQSRELSEYIKDLMAQIISLCNGKETRATLDVDDGFTCTIRIYYHENEEFPESSAWNIDIQFARRLKRKEVPDAPDQR
ncbi:hypothetical protein [Spirosoma rhododendri]|uniref:Uncharacterized protein n=1 Tax=Spirosoma rhododendri TaxID=2728024 RepID=A0A7L5DM26_9BACT|nr:hypothetical protein [Spirosoma rhododendri]QJD79519.1 hypothetical protein HH216_14705 [Spirosoma rhododendri]